MRRRIFISAVPLVFLAACDGQDETGIPADREAEPGVRDDRPSPSSVPLGNKVELAGEELAGSITVADARVIDAPEGWSTRQVVATVDIDLSSGQLTYSEPLFSLVSPEGERTAANTVASDVGLPGKALGSGDLTAPRKARGLVTFDAPPAITGGWSIEFSDPYGPGTFVWELP